MIKATDFIKKAEELVYKKTVYLWGGWGQPLTNTLIDQKAGQYPSVYNKSKVAKLKSLVSQGYLGIDCSGLLKMIHWGYPNHKYNNGGMPDTNANGYINMCRDVSTNFASIVPGEAVWMNGHIGLYAGVYDSVKWVIESTPSWKDGVQWTKLSARKWVKHGKMPNVDYSTSQNQEVKLLPSTKDPQVTATTLNVRTGPGVDHPVLTQLKKGDTVKIEGTENGWAKLSAYVSSDYISAPAPTLPKGRVTTGGQNLNIRSGPNTSYPIVDKLGNGDIVSLHERVGDWYKIADGKYAHGNFIVTL